MKVVTVTDFRKNMKKLMDKATGNHEPILVTRKDSKNLVVLSEEDYESLKNATKMEELFEGGDNLEDIPSGIDFGRGGLVAELYEVEDEPKMIEADSLDDPISGSPKLSHHKLKPHEGRKF